MNNAFCFILKDLFVLEIFTLCPYFFDHVGKRLDKKARVNFKIYDAMNWEINNCNTYIAHYLKKWR